MRAPSKSRIRVPKTDDNKPNIQGQCFSPGYSRFESSGKPIVVRMETLTNDRIKTYVAPEKKQMTVTSVQHRTDQDV